MSPVFISNVDDYVAPSQACVNPLFSESVNMNRLVGDETISTTDTTINKKKNIENTNGIVIRKKRPMMMRRRKRPVPLLKEEEEEKKSEAAAEIAKVTMADCLACSGCVTSAETVLVEQHSLTKLEEKLRIANDENGTIVITISPSSWADLIRHLQISTDGTNNRISVIKRRITTALHQALSSNIIVLDGSIPLQWSLLEAAHEFCRAYNNEKKKNASNGEKLRTKEEEEEAPPRPSVAISSTESRVYESDGSVTTIFKKKKQISSSSSITPLISSSCPALVCWIEKSQPTLIHNLSTARSSMSMAGAYFSSSSFSSSSSSSNNNNNNNELLHIAIMPCHDKKLEASRKDFSSDGKKQEVDIVLTTKEWFELLSKKNAANKSENIVVEDIKRYILSLEPSKIVSSLHHVNKNHDDDDKNDEPSVAILVDNDDDDNSSLLLSSEEKNNNENSSSTTATGKSSSVFHHSSGGYADFIFRSACKELFGHVLCTTENLPWKSVGMQQQQQSSKKKVVSARVAALRKRQQLYSVALYRIKENHRKSKEEEEEESIITKTPSPVYSLTYQEGAEIVLNFAIAHGFQTMQRILDVNNNNYNNFEKYDYIEAMACPSACVNGGGQNPLLARETPKETRERVKATRSMLSQDFKKKKENNNNRDIYNVIGDENNDSRPFGPEALFHLHTQYHIVPPMQQYSTGAVAGVAVNDTQW